MHGGAGLGKHRWTPDRRQRLTREHELVQKLLIASLCITIGQFTVPAHAQDAIDTNRPGFSSSPYVLATGMWQIESGIDYDDDTPSSVTLPLVVLRYGVADEMELLVDWGGFRRDSGGGSSANGITDASVGVKFQVTDDENLAVAMLVDVSVPVGSSEFSSDSWDPAVGVAWQYSGSLTWAGTAQITRQSGNYGFDNGVKLVFAPLGAGSAFVEWEANLPDSGGATHALNGGYLWLRTPNAQFDVNASIGLNDRAPDWGLGFGYAFRF
jgi:hypothetical protein